MNYIVFGKVNKEFSLMVLYKKEKRVHLFLLILSILETSHLDYESINADMVAEKCFCAFVTIITLHIWIQLVCFIQYSFLMLNIFVAHVNL